MPGILYVVATPIGNLEDVTLRGLRILREVSLIAAEDTRRTAKLLQHYSIPTPTTSLHEHNERQRIPQLLQRLSAGESIALVSDAGTPAISDPGERLVAAAHGAGLTVLPVPGPSAVTAVVSASGIPGPGFTFVGFPPPRSGARERLLQALADEPRPVVFYEAPHRIRALLHDIARTLGERKVAVGRELTKIHEELAVRPISEWLEGLPPEQGEFAIVVAPADPDSDRREILVDDRRLADEYQAAISDRAIGRREALRQVAARFGVSTRKVYQAVEAAKSSVDRPTS